MIHIGLITHTHGHAIYPASFAIMHKTVSIPLKITHPTAALFPLIKKLQITKHSTEVAVRPET